MYGCYGVAANDKIQSAGIGNFVAGHVGGDDRACFYLWNDERHAVSAHPQVLRALFHCLSFVEIVYGDGQCSCFHGFKHQAGCFLNRFSVNAQAAVSVYLFVTPPVAMVQVVGVVNIIIFLESTP